MIKSSRIGFCVLMLAFQCALSGWTGTAAAGPVSDCTSPIMEGDKGQCEFVLKNGNAFPILVGTGVGSLARLSGTSEDGVTISIAVDDCMGKTIQPGHDCRIHVSIMTGPVDGPGMPDIDFFTAGMTSPATNADTGNHIASISETAEFGVFDKCKTGESASRAGRSDTGVCAIPEPDTFWLAGIGLSSALGCYSWRRRRHEHDVRRI